MMRDNCNTCGAPRGGQHKERCHLTGEVVAWSGVLTADVITERELVRRADALNARIENCHTEVACPKCGARVGTKCRRVNGITSLSAAPLKHPHAERWQQIVPAR